jgi:hypothetical protein
MLRLLVCVAFGIVGCAGVLGDSQPADSDTAAGDTTTGDATQGDTRSGDPRSGDPLPPGDPGSTGDSGAADRTECTGWQGTHPEWVWCDDFEGEQDLTVNYQDTSLNGLAATTEDAFSGNYGLRQHYDAGQVDAGWISRFYADALGNDYGPVHDEIYVRWYHKFEAAFFGAPPKMARLRSLGPGWDKRFSVLYWIDPDTPTREIVADVSVPFSSQANSSGYLPVARSDFYYSDPANIGRWICHEMYVNNNTPGQADGTYRYWADSRLIIERTGVDLRGSTSFNFNEAMLDTYWNGGSPVAQNRYYDNCVISTERVGCLP